MPDKVVRGSRFTVEEPEEIANWNANTFASGPRKGKPKGRPPVVIISPFGLMVVKKDGEAVAYVTKRYAETVRAAIEAEASR